MITKKILMSIMMLLTMSLTFVACSDDGTTTSTTSVTVSLEMPINISDAILNNVFATLTNVQTGKIYTLDGFAKTGEVYTATLNDVPVGSYNVTVNGEISYTIDGTATTTNVKAVQNNVAVAQGTTPGSVKLVLATYNAKEGFVISELYYSGSATKENKQYIYDQYIKITNNTDHTLYADSLAFVESEFNNTSKYVYRPNIMEQAISVCAIYMIPGNGRSVPVEPGKSLLLAIDARNHTSITEKAYDLSKADFEFYDVSTNSVVDQDNPDVPNLDKWYCYTKSIYILHSRGYKSFALVKLQGNKEEFLKNNFYQPEYTFVSASITKNMKTSAYKIPNSWVVDAVNIGVEGKTEWNVFAASLDLSWTYVAESATDKSYYNKSVIRKMVNGKYQDTNDSRNDFIPRSTPSLAK